VNVVNWGSRGSQVSFAVASPYPWGCLATRSEKSRHVDPCYAGQVLEVAKALISRGRGIWVNMADNVGTTGGWSFARVEQIKWTK